MEDNDMTEIPQAVPDPSESPSPTDHPETQRPVEADVAAEVLAELLRSTAALPPQQKAATWATSTLLRGAQTLQDMLDEIKDQHGDASERFAQAKELWEAKLSHLRQAERYMRLQLDLDIRQSRQSWQSLDVLRANNRHLDTHGGLGASSADPLLNRRPR
jgi:hypothetical protein